MSESKMTPQDTEAIAKSTFPYVRPRAWKNKLSGDVLKVVPWFMPLENESRYDLTGLMKDIEPGLFEHDSMKDFEVYKGLVMRTGWLIENSSNIWMGLAGPKFAEHFEDLGLWDEETHRPQAGIYNRVDQMIADKKEKKNETPETK